MKIIFKKNVARKHDFIDILTSIHKESINAILETVKEDIPCCNSLGALKIIVQLPKENLKDTKIIIDSHCCNDHKIKFQKFINDIRYN